MPYINVDEAYVLDNTGLQVDQSVDYANANGNVNLIDNWYFVGGGGAAFPINQRGKTSYTGSAYSIDRWYLSGGSLTASVQSDCVQFTASGGNGLLFQYFKTPLTGTFTISAYIRGTGAGYIGVCDATSDHDLISGTAQTFSNVGNDWTLIKRTFTTSTPIGGIRCRVDAGTTFDMQSIKLECGSFTTLPNDPPPNRATELAKCQYYCRVFNPSSGYIYLGGYCQSTTVFRSFALPPMNIRSSAPSVTPSTLTTEAVVIDASGTSHSVSAIASTWQTDTEIGVTLFATTTGLTTGQTATLRITQGATIVVSCDL